MIGSLVGKYRLVRLLGAGGMGEVYLGEHVVLKQLRAVKVLLPEYTKYSQIIERFVGEAKAVATIRHRNVVGVDDVEQLASGVCYMVLEYLEGGTLARYIASHGGPIAIHDAVHVLAQAASGLQAAHDRGIVHRDLKPENMFLVGGSERQVKLIDFGIARLTDGLRSGGVTKTGVVVGTPQYMAPEQHRGERVGPAADLYALGVILYEVLTGGWLPYLDEHASKGDHCRLTSEEIFHRQMSRAPFDPRRRVAGLSDACVELMLAALDRDPARRPSSAREFGLRLADSAPGDGFYPHGIEIVRRVARELLDDGHLPDTLQAPRPTPEPPMATRFQLGRKLGAGGMAEVYMATIAGAEGFQRQVAIKRVLAGLSEMPGFAAMFVQEAQIMSRLDHPNIVGIVAFDRDPDGRLFLAMEYVDGRDLASLANTGRLPISVAIFVVTEILQGLGYAHDFPDPTGRIRGVVHRDVSPHNVLLAWTGAVKVSDFGIAKAFAASGARSELVKGKPQYMSPEQVQAEPLDGRSDLFAVGIMLWELLTGRALFAGTSKEVMSQVCFRDIPRPGDVRKDVPRDVEAVTMKLLERDRARRYASAEQAIDDLLRCTDAPRNGRRELVRLLAERFPALAPARASDAERCGALQARAPERREPTVTHITAVVPPLARPGNAASRARPRPAGGLRRLRRRRRRTGIAAAVGIVLVGGAVAGLGLWARPGGSGGTPAADAGVALAHRDVLPPDAPASATPPDAAPPVDAAIAAAPRDARAAPAIEPPAPSAPREPRPAPFAARPPAAAAATGELVIAVEPYAEVWLDNRAIGATPLRTRVPVGPHRVRLVNQDLQIRKSLTVNVSTDKPTRIEETW